MSTGELASSSQKTPAQRLRTKFWHLTGSVTASVAGRVGGTWPEAWRIHERERVVRVKIQALQETEENQ